MNWIINMGLFTPLTFEEKSLLQFPSGILASGEANFEDSLQTETKTIFTTSTPLLNRNGFEFTENTNLSNAKKSRDFSINDFSIFNPYIHYQPNPAGGSGVLDKISFAFTIDTTKFYNLAVSGFNIYSQKYRN